MNISTANKAASAPRFPTTGPAGPKQGSANQATEGAQAPTDQVTLSQTTPTAPSQASPAQAAPAKPPSGLKRVATRTITSLVLGTLPAVATCAALMIGGASAAGLCLAGGIVAGGLVASRLLAGETSFKTAFGAGGWLGLISGAAGMAGPVGVAVMAGMILAKQAVGEITYAMDYGHIAGKAA